MSHASELVMTDGHWIMLLLGESADGYPPSGDTGDTGYIVTYTILLCYLCPQFTVWVEFFDVFVLLTCHGSDRGKYHFAMESQVLDLPGSAWDDCLRGDPGARSGTSGHRGTGSGILVNIPLRQQNRTTSAIGNQLLHHFLTSSLHSLRHLLSDL